MSFIIISIMCHHPTLPSITSPHHSSYHHLTILPSPHLTTLPSPHLTTLPYHHLTTHSTDLNSDVQQVPHLCQAKVDER